MEKAIIHLVATFLLSFLLQDAYSATIEHGIDLFDTLLARIELLEASDVANKAKIAELESEFKDKMTEHEREISGLKIKISEMESKFERKEAAMHNEINELKTTLTDSTGDCDKQLLDGKNDAERRPQNKIQRQGGNPRQHRDVPETEVAFYATHVSNAIHHLGSNQILQFTVALTNIGNAFNNNTGGFTAPVDGTYVIHATIMGIDVTAASNQHMHAHFDVNGTAYSKFNVTPYDQSSQMLVIELKAGQTVTIRNDDNDAGFIGQHYTTFSGFLLYQHFPSGAIIGK